MNNSLGIQYRHEQPTKKVFLCEHHEKKNSAQRKYIGLWIFLLSKFRASEYRSATFGVGSSKTEISQLNLNSSRVVRTIQIFNQIILGLDIVMTFFVARNSLNTFNDLTKVLK